MKQYFTSLLLSLLVYSAYGQGSLYVKTGVGWYNMREMQDFHAELPDDLIVPAKIVNNFPATMVYELGYRQHSGEDWFSGLFFGYHSTGARIHYADYSGELKIDQIINGYRLGTQGGICLTRDRSDNEVSFWLSGRLSGTYNRLNLNQRLQVYESSESNSVDFRSVNIGIQPSLSLRIPVYFLSVEPEIGYELQIPGKLFLEEDAFLLDRQGEEVKVNWSGLRLGISVAKAF